MIGNNSLHLNTVTMMQAVQQWLDIQMPAGAPTVTGIKCNNNEGIFVVQVSSDPTKAKEQP